MSSARGLQIIFGTRGSELARAQAGMAEAAVRGKLGTEVRTDIIRSRGERSRTAEVQSGRKGIFTAELELALIEGRVDVAVHSAKDLPSEMDPRLALAAALPRAGAEDVLIMKAAGQLCSMPDGAKIGTASVRRSRQVRWFRPEFEVVELRGNVPTRLRKFAASNWNAIVLARAGLERLGLGGMQFEFEQWQFFAEVLAVDTFVPAGGQGVIVLQTRATEVELVSAVDHDLTHNCLRAEREFLKLMQGDCNLPVGVHARYANGEIHLHAQLFGEGPTPKIASGQGTHPESLAAEVFRKIAVQ